MMDVETIEAPRFPWGYLVAMLVPMALVGATWLSGSIADPGWRMSAGMAAALLIGPASAVVILWGIVRLSCGEARTYPALRWLVWLPALVGVVGVALR
jgi:hypothetical protein